MLFTLEWIGFALPSMQDFMKCLINTTEALQPKIQWNIFFQVWIAAIYRQLFTIWAMNGCIWLMVTNMKRQGKEFELMHTRDPILAWTSRRFSLIKTKFDLWSVKQVIRNQLFSFGKVSLFLPLLHRCYWNFLLPCILPLPSQYIFLMFLVFPAQWPCRSLHSIFCCGCLPEVYSKPYIRYFRCHQLRGNSFWSFSSLVSFIYIGFFQTSSFSSAPFWPSFLDGKFDIFYFEVLFLFLFIFLEALTADAYIFSPFRGRLLKCWDLILYFWV